MAEEHTHPGSGFDANHTIQSAKTGKWSTASTWLPRRVPGPADVVRVVQGHSITADKDVDVRILGLDGDLVITGSRKLRLETLVVNFHGTLQIGTKVKPIGAASKVEISWKDTPLDPAFPAAHGFFVEGGKANIFGAPKTEYVRLAKEPKAGEWKLALETAPKGWRTGDVVAIPGTCHLPWHDNQAWQWWHNHAGQDQSETFQYEERTITRVSGKSVYVDLPLRYDHLGARDHTGKLRFLPHVANLTRNVVFRSENPQGVRGQGRATHGGRVDLNCCSFLDMGRTRTERLGPENVKAEYSWHHHHNNPTLDEKGFAGYQVGIVILRAPRWCFSIHQSDCQFVHRCIFLGGKGAGLVMEDGNERFNYISQNIAGNCAGYNGTDTDRNPEAGGDRSDWAWEGSAFAMRAGGNTFVNNIAWPGTNAAFQIWGYGGFGNVRVPLFPGASRQKEGEYFVTNVHGHQIPFDIFEGNEAYGPCKVVVHCGVVSPHVIRSLRAWHVPKVYEAFMSDYGLLLDATVIGDKASLKTDPTGKPGGIVVDAGGATLRHTIIRNGEFENIRTITVRAPGTDTSTIIEGEVLVDGQPAKAG